METSKRQQGLGRMYILFATLLWGTSFVVLKNTLDEVPVFFILGIRFSIAALIMLLISRKHLSGIDRNRFSGCPFAMSGHKNNSPKFSLF